MKIYTGHKHGCAPVTGRLVRLRGLAFLVVRHPVTGWTWFCVDEDTIEVISDQQSVIREKESEADGQARTNAKRKA